MFYEFLPIIVWLFFIYRFEMWFNDSVATSYMSKTRNWFHENSDVEFNMPHSIKLENGDVIYALCQGNINILAFKSASQRSL